ncbi:DUF2922 domain-containing protein [Enterococcus sp. AZ109]|uniref:DUF2922 domain-containing protein n=1 Tax=Enterococcus sp. AZ109 TaxID=2774634 RepID=UPI003F1F6538
MIKLVGTFLNDAGKKHNLIMKDPNTNLSPEVVRENLELLTTLDLFEKDGVALFQETVSAKYVETIETPIFEKEEVFGDADEPVTLNQSLLNRMPATEQAEVPEEEKVEAAENHQKLEELKAQSSYRDLPQVPTVSLEKPKEEVSEVPAEVPEDAPEQETKPKPYNLISQLIHRKNRRKAQEKQKKNLN